MGEHNQEVRVGEHNDQEVRVGEYNHPVDDAVGDTVGLDILGPQGEVPQVAYIYDGIQKDSCLDYRCLRASSTEKNN